MTESQIPASNHTVHAAIYKWKADAPLQEIETAIDSLRGITNDVPGIRLITWGRNESQYSEGFTHAIVIVADTPDAIQAYREHSLHQPVADLLNLWEDVGVGVDFTESAASQGSHP